MINALLGLTGMFICMLLMIVIWLASGWPRWVQESTWCSGRAYEGRDLIFLAAVTATVVFSLLWWYQPGERIISASCQYTEPGVQVQVCQDAAIITGHHNAWHHDRNWLPIAGMLLVVLIVLARIHTRWMKPVVARIITRLLMVAVDILAIWQLFIPYDPDVSYDKLWPIYAAFCMTLIASFVTMRSLPFLIRWLIE